MRFALFLLFIISASFHVICQDFGNEWISFASNSNDYYRFRVSGQGLYRISSSQLSAAGVNLGQVNGANFQLFYRGQEVPVYTSTPGPLGSLDYLEFFADVHDGAFDSLLFKDKSWQLQKYKSLFTDSVTFFLTWNSLTLNKRYDATLNDLSSLPQNDTSFRHEELMVYTSHYHSGKPFQVSSNSLPFNFSDFDEGEGRTDYFFTSSTQSYSIPIHNQLGTDSADFEIVIVGKSNRIALNPDHHVLISIGSDTIDRTFDGYEIFRASKKIDASGLSSPYTNCAIKAVADLYNPDRIAVSYIKLNYNRGFDFNNKKEFMFTLDGDSANRKYLEIDNFNDLNSQSIMYDLTNNLRLEGQENLSIHQFALPVSNTNRSLYLSSEGDIGSVSGLKKIEFINFYDVNNQGDYLIITHPNLQDSSSGTNWVREYADYRNSQGYTTRVINIESLIDQFAYGNLHHPLSMVRFVDLIEAQWFYDLKAIFLIGQGEPYSGYSSGNLVPTFGNIPSDNMLTAELGDFRPRVPIGRLAVTDPDEVRIYLDKVKDHEQNIALPQTIDSKSWMKEVLHFGGGADIIEQQQFESYLNQYRDILEDTSFGGHVTTFLKNSSNPIQIAYFQLFDSLLTNGVSIMNFFGHSSSNSFDFSVDVPENYNNHGKYPLVISNGCYSGNIFTSGSTMSKRFILQENKGAIGFLAASGLSYSSYDHNYSYHFINNLSKDNYGMSLGGLIKETIYDVYDTSDMFIRYTSQVFNLHGEPLIQLNPHVLPDFAIDVNHVFYEPSYVTVNEDTFNLNIVVYNIGKAVKDSLFVRVSRTFPDGTEVIAYEAMRQAPFYKDTFSIPIETNAELALGINKLTVIIDPTDQPPNLQIDEIEDYLNNEIEVELLILSDDILPVYPYNFSIVSDNQPTLNASTVNVFAPQRRVVFQIDTTELFSSAIFKDTIIDQIGGVIKWEPSINYIDSVVYYWRVSLDSIYSGSYKWNTYSFMHWPEENEGWNQSHLYQFQKNDFANVKIEQHERFEFIDDLKDIMLYSYNWALYPNAIPGGKDIGYYLNGVYKESISCLYNFWPRGGISFAVFDSTTVLPWTSEYNGTSVGDLGNKHCKPYTMYAFNFPDSVKNNSSSTQLWRSRIIDFIDTIPDGSYVLAYLVPGSSGPFTETWGDDLYSSIEALGSTMIRQVPNRCPWGLFVKKGDQNFSITEQKSDTTSGAVNFNVNVNSSWTQGYWVSPAIGPAAQWKSLSWDYEVLDAIQEEFQLDVIGVDRYGVETVLISGVSAKDTSLQHILARDYPSLKLSIDCRDDSLRTPLQLKYWRVFYEPLPEACLNPSAYLNFYNDTLSEGDTISFSCMVENISKRAMDSLLIEYYILNDNQGVVKVPYERQDSLRVSDSLLSIVNYPTWGLKGDNRLLVKVNPDYDQKEYTLFNNIGLLSFYVRGDKLNPLLDVTFDGIHILDGDIVSSSPEIRISLDDENQFLALDDTALINVFLVNPNGEMIRQKFNSPNMQFYPASANLSESNKAEVYLFPEFNSDGVYKLIVQGQDKSSNSSGLYDYIISFEVIQETSVTSILNYPNPFTSQTRFVFTLTGSEIPDQFKIRIMTISGKVVKEIGIEDIGPIHIGRNISEYAWDGTDDYGDPLANGVYLYQVILGIGGDKIKHRPTEIDQYFKKGIGKMVLIR